MRGVSEGSPAVYALPPGLKSVLTSKLREGVYWQDHYQRPQHHLLLEVQGPYRDHRPGAGHREKWLFDIIAGRDGNALIDQPDR